MASERRRGRNRDRDYDRPPVEDADALLPPQDLEAEQATLGAILLGGEGARMAKDMVEPRDFYRDSHEAIVAAAYGLLNAGEQVDLVTVSGALRRQNKLDAVGGIGYLERLVNATPYSSNVRQYATAVRVCAIRRRALYGSRDAAKACFEEPPAGERPEVMLGAIEAKFKALAEQVRAESPRPAYACDAVACSDALANGQARYEVVCQTGLPTLDSWLLGGIQRPETHLIQGDGGGGKSSMAVTLLARAALAGRRVGHIALELPQAGVTKRFYSAVSDFYGGVSAIPHWAMNDGVPQKPLWASAYREIDDWSRSAGLWHVIDFTQCGRTIYAVQQAIRYLAEDRGCRLVCVDNFTNVRVPGSRGFEAGQDVADMLDDSAKDLRLPLLVCCQTNARGEIFMAPTAFHDAGVCLEVRRPKGQTTGTLFVRKNREGDGEGPIPLVGHKDTLTWYEGSPPDDDGGWRDGKLAAAGRDDDDYDPWSEGQ